MPRPRPEDFTREQRIAQSADRHQAVTAGAGAGKTRVLVERYIDLLFNPSIQAGVREIVAITFTRKAAAEMRHRIAEVIESRLADEAYRSDWKRIKDIRERFAGARISTIHSYCAQLLREFPIEAGVNPNFTELEEYDVTILKEQAINETLEAWLEADEPKKKPSKKTAKSAESEQSDNAEQQSELSEKQVLTERQEKQQAARRVWTFFGKQNLFALLETLLKNSERFDDLANIYAAKSNDLLFQEAETTFLRRVYALAEEYVATLTEAVGCLDFEALSSTTRPRFEQLSSSLAILLKQAREAAQMLAPEQTTQNEEKRAAQERLWQNALEYATLLVSSTQSDKVITGKGVINGQLTRSDKYFRDRELYARLNGEAGSTFHTLGAMLGVMQHHDDDRVLLDIARTLMRIAADAWMIVREEKERLGGLDFDDLQQKADALLNNADVRSNIRLKTRYLMIDEFQDTDELQYRIARKIIGVLGENAESVPSMTNLFIVGDPKQSIYRFRGADVRVFAKAKRDIERFNRMLLNHGALSVSITTPFGTETVSGFSSGESEKFGITNLRATFRLLPEIAAFVNVVAGDQLRRGTTEFDVEYNDIVCGAKPSPVRGTVTMLLPRVLNDSLKDEVSEFTALAEQYEQLEKPAELSAEDGNEETTTEVSEARLLAEYICSIAAPNAAEPVTVRSSNGTPRPATFSDVMILVRSRTGTDALLTALRRADVPFIVSAGRGFYEQQEILDIRSFLLFLQNTNDDIALAAVLRSPFFALTDTELFHISRTEVSASVETSSNALWQRFEAYCESEPTSNASTDALRAFTVLKNLLPLAAQLSIPSLIRTILEQTSLRAMLVAEERFQQMEANVEKLLSIARKYENKGFRNLYDFAEELRRLALYAFSEGEADTETGKNAVTIMTIHGAKGLEAPIVALFNINADSGGGERGVSLSFDNHLGMSFKMFRLRDNGTLEHYKTPLHYMASKQDDIAEEAEMKRLLYVALTRAKDHLILSGKCRQSKDGTMTAPKGFFKMIVESLNAEHLNLLNEPYISLPSHTLSLLDGEQMRETLVQYNMPIIRALEQLPSKRLPNKVFEANSETNDITNTVPISQKKSFEELPPMLLGTLETSVEGDYYSASQLQLFERDPEEYERLYRLGLPPADDDGFIVGRASGVEDDSDATIGTSAGECIHAVLEHLSLWMNIEGAFLANDYQRVVERVLPQKMAFIPPDLLARIQRETQAVAATPLLKRCAGDLNAAKFEFPITLPVGSDFLIGSIDVLLNHNANDGDVEIWDWKTNRVGSVRDMDTLLKQYRLQLEVYAFVVSFLRPEQQTFRTRLLFTRRATATAADEDWTRVLEFTRLDIQAIEEKIQRLIGKIRLQSYGVEVSGMTF